MSNVDIKQLANKYLGVCISDADEPETIQAILTHLSIELNRERIQSGKPPMVRSTFQTPDELIHEFDL